jgi:nitrate/nitrite transport system permease protein
MTALESPVIPGPDVRERDDSGEGRNGAAARPESAPPPRRSRLRERAVSLAFALLGLAVFVAFWALVAWRNSDVPGPLDAWSELSSLLVDGFVDSGPNGRGILLRLGTSLGLTLKGFGLAALVGIPLGLLTGGHRRAWQAVNPVVQLLKPVSPLAWFPIGLVAFKSSPTAAVFVIFICALWPIVINTAVGASSVPVDQRNVARVFQFNRAAYLRQVVIPHTVPSIITGLRLAMGIAWMVIVAVEMLSGGTGIGSFVWDSYNAGNLAAVMAAIIVIGVVGVVLDTVFVSIGRRYTGEVTR